MRFLPLILAFSISIPSGFCESVHNILPPNQTHSAPIYIPFSYLNGFIIVQASINNGFPIQLLFDTGSEFTILTEPLIASSLSIQATEPIRLIGADVSLAITGLLSRRNSIAVGPLFISSQSVIIIESALLDLQTLTGQPVFGILGSSSFGAYALTINYATEQLELRPTGSFRAKPSTTVVPLQVEKSKAYVTLATQIHSAFRDSLKFLIDTGAALEMMLFTSKADTTLFPPKLIPGAIGYGLGGDVQGFVGRSDSVLIGKLSLPNILTYFQVNADSSLSENLVSRRGIIGNELLSRFTVTIDFPGRKLYLEPRGGYKKPRAFDKSGLKLILDGQSTNTVKIQLVVPGSPADDAGLRSGDRVYRLNGIPIRLLSMSTIQRMLRAKEGKSIRLLIGREDKTIEVKFTLRKMI